MSGRGGAHLASDRSDHEGQFGEGIGETEGGTHIRPEIVVAPAEVLDEGVRGDDDPGGTVPLQPPHRSKPGLQASVVGLEWVVGIDLRVMEGRWQHLLDDAGVEAVPVRGDLDGREPGAADCLGEEPPRCSCVPARREVHVDDLAELVDGPEQVAPGPSDLQVRLIDMPAIADDVPAGSGRLGELRRKPRTHRYTVTWSTSMPRS